MFYRGGWCPYCNITLRTYQVQLVPPLAGRSIAEPGTCPSWTIRGHPPSITSEEGIFHQMKVIRNPAGQHHIRNTPAHPGNQRQGMMPSAIRPAYPALSGSTGLTYAK